MNMDHLKVYSITLDQLFNGTIEGLEGSQKILIPEYQRSYVWTQKQIVQLLSDLQASQKDCSSDKPLYYLGSIIIHQTNDGLQIIDGQQRITTMLLLQQFLNTNITTVHYSNPLSIHQIKSNYEFLKALFDGDYFDYIDLVDVKESLQFQNINITLVITKSEDLAYTFFETQNTGGVRLSGSDIIKAHHLRAVDNRKIVAYQAKRWEENQKHVEDIIGYLGKLRYWDNRYWRQYPGYRMPAEKKNTVINEFCIDTEKTDQDISYHYQISEKRNGNIYTSTLSRFKQVRQPLHDGNNTLDYINDYLKLYTELFIDQNNHSIQEDFYTFYKDVVHGKDGTIFLKDLFEACVIAYVSKFGYERLYETSLWMYRTIFSLRITLDRNVREDSVFKLVKDTHLIDTILDIYTPEDLIKRLKKDRFKFNKNYTESSHSKSKHIETLKSYFGYFKQASDYQENYDFDKQFVLLIKEKLR
ncbi:Protein of unknown function DUF262 [Chryseobacterium culicis]|uniref:Uncharacterized protein n=2 Tax=Chryseobacterium culicis TaxID=680127 RepID=A0A1H6H1L4_CHRCI|nr:Protein of unknown function DUF262 [Chryseobacterium culicis]